MATFNEIKVQLKQLRKGLRASNINFVSRKDVYNNLVKEAISLISTEWSIKILDILKNYKDDGSLGDKLEITSQPFFITCDNVIYPAISIMNHKTFSNYLSTPFKFSSVDEINMFITDIGKGLPEKDVVCTCHYINYDVFAEPMFYKFTLTLDLNS